MATVYMRSAREKAEDKRYKTSKKKTTTKKKKVDMRSTREKVEAARYKSPTKKIKVTPKKYSDLKENKIVTTIHKAHIDIKEDLGTLKNSVWEKIFSNNRNNLLRAIKKELNKK